MDDIDIFSTYDVERIALLGGEPMLIENLDEIVDRLDSKITIYTNGTLLQSKEDIVEDVIYAVSLDGLDVKMNDSIRGKGTHKKVMKAIDTLIENRDMVKEIVIRTTYNKRNYEECFKLMEFCEDRDIGLALHPRIGTETYNGKQWRNINAQEQLKLFTELAKHDKMVVLTPHFMQWAGREHYRCPAGSFRFSCYPSGDVKPCQWGDYIIGNFRRDSFDTLLERGERYNKEFVRSSPPNRCMGCPRVNGCYGGCKLVKDTRYCPVKVDESFRIGRVLSESQVSDFQTSVKNLGNIGFSGC